VCGFEDERICGFSQDRTDMFDWTRQNHLTQNPKRSANTGPEKDRSGTKEGTNTLGLVLVLPMMHCTSIVLGMVTRRFEVQNVHIQ